MTTFDQPPTCKMKSFVMMPKKIVRHLQRSFISMLTFERGGFFGIIIGDDEDIGRRPDVIPPPPAAVSFSICETKIILNN